MSSATVSKVLNGRSDVSAATRERVSQLLAELDYLPPQRSAGVVDIVFNGLDSPWAIEILRGVETHLSGHGRSVAVSVVPRGGPVRPASWTGAVARHHSAGVLLVMSQLSTTQLRELDHQGIPLVVIDPAGTPDRQVPSVGATNWDGGIAATDHLLQLGHRRIAVISGPQRYLCSRARVEGYRHALESGGIEFDSGLVRWGDFRHEGGFRCAEELLAIDDPPTAIFAGSDQQALGVYEAARQHGLAVPDQLQRGRLRRPAVVAVAAAATDDGAPAAG